MDEYVCIYDQERVMNHCVRTKANNVDEAKDKFIEYLKSKHHIKYIDTSKLYLINYSYLGKI